MLCDSDTAKYFKNEFFKLSTNYSDLSKEIIKINGYREDLLTKFQDLVIKKKNFKEDCDNLKNNSSLNYQDNIKLIDSKITELTSTIEATFQKIFLIHKKNFSSYTDKIRELNQHRLELFDQIRLLQIQYKHYKHNKQDEYYKQDEYNKQDKNEYDDEYDKQYEYEYEDKDDDEDDKQYEYEYGDEDDDDED